MTLNTSTRLGAYEVLGLIGAGGMGEVYRARDTKLNREDADRGVTRVRRRLRKSAPREVSTD